MLSLYKYTKGYRLQTFLTPFFVICEVFMEVIIPLLMGRIVNTGIMGLSNGVTPENIALVHHDSILLVLCALCSLLFGCLAGWTAASASTGFTLNLRKAMYDKIQLFSFKNIDHFSQGGIVTRLTSDAFYVQTAFHNIIRMGVRLPIMLIFALYMVVHIGEGSGAGIIAVRKQLGNIYLVAIPVLAIFLIVITMITVPLFNKAFDEIDALNNNVQENIHAIKVVKSFAREDYEKKKFNVVIVKLYKMLVGAEMRTSVTFPVMRLVVYACMLLIAFIASKRIVVGDLQTGDLMALFIYNYQMLFSMMVFAMITSMIIMSGTCYHRIMEIFNEKLDIIDPANPVMAVEDGRIEFKNVDFSYSGDKDKLVLHDVNFSIRSGERIGVVGVTGSGKSSLVNLIARLYDTTVGEVCVGGVNVRDYDIKTLRDNVAVVLQKNNLFSGTIRSSLSWGKKNASDEEIWRVLKVAQASDFVSAFPEGLDHEVAQQGANFSGGQRQRLCIARALLKDPKILIMDDSSSALDTATDRNLRQSLQEDRPSLTKIIIAHKVLSVMDCDRIIVMERGSIADIGTHVELLERNKFYHDLYESQTRKEEENGGLAND